MIFKAIEFATRAHSGQYRKKTKIPYITHPLHVAEILIELDCTEDTIIAAILHDTIEDSETTVSDLKNEFGENVAKLVQYVTEPKKSLPWETRKQHTLESIAALPVEAVLILCADKLHNLQSISYDLEKEGESVWDRFSRPKNRQSWYFHSLIAEIKKRQDTEKYSSLFSRLEKEVIDLFGEKSGE